MKKPAPFPTEVALCAEFLDAVDKRKWIPYPEACGWDILMVRRADGFQIGIQAKLKMGTDVINQAIEGYRSWSSSRPGPDCRAVLVPSCGGFGLICEYLGLVVITVEPPSQYRSVMRYRPRLPDAPPAPDYDNWPEWAPAKRHKLPEYVPDVAAGASGPIQLTEWKIKAIKLSVLLETHGSVTRDDFAFLRLDSRRWLEGGWLSRQNGALVVGPGMPNFKKQHPKVYVQIAAEIAKWSQPDRKTQAALL